ncbi:MAG: UDP-2,3-diacylglucosamine diphosphatase LpxI [Sumerlaeia bacterium]
MTDGKKIPKLIGLIAGEGDFPVLLAHGARSSGVRVIAFGINGLASDRLAPPLTEGMHTLKLTDLSRLFELCHQHGIEHLIMAGRVPHKVLLRQISLDSRVLKLLGNLRNKKADSLLKAAVQEIEAEGIKVLDSTLFLKSCMPEEGILTPGFPLSEEIRRDMMFGYPIAKEIARLDIGQTIAVKNQIVVAVEGVEGTDALIRRAGELAGPGVVIVKVSKPRQDLRFDVPVIGIKTIRSLMEANAGGICITAGESLFFDREESVAKAEAEGISILAYRETGTETPYEEALR